MSRSTKSELEKTLSFKKTDRKMRHYFRGRGSKDRRKVSDIGGSTRKKGTYEVGTYLRFSYERPWHRWLFQVLQMSKKSC